MRLVKLQSRDGQVFEEELASCKHFERIWRSIMQRYEVNPLDDSPFPVNLDTDRLEQLMSWGRLHTRDPVCTDTSLSCIKAHLNEKEIVFLFGRRTESFLRFGPLAEEVKCPRLYAEWWLLQQERKAYCEEIKDMEAYSPAQLEALHMHEKWKRDEQQERRRIFGDRLQL